MALRPTLLVGLGTSGMRIVNEVEKLMYASFGVSSKPHCRSIYVETNKAEKPEDTPKGSDLVPVTIAADKMSTAVESLSAMPNLDLDWVSKDLGKQMEYNQLGAGGVRPAGRVLLWASGNFDRLYKEISREWTELNKPGVVTFTAEEAARGDEPGPVIYVVGSLVGGTCSGTFIDVGYMIRKITKSGNSGVNRARGVELFGAFLLPTESTVKLDMGMANAHGALQELEEFHRTGHEDEQWPNSVFSDATDAGPFDNVHLISTEYGDGSGSMDLASCYSVVAMKLFLDCIGMSAVIGPIIVDGRNSGSYSFYTTFGLSAVMYPRYPLGEAAACDLGNTLCKRWLDRQTLYDDTGEMVGNVNEPNVYDEACRLLRDGLTHAFDRLESRGNRPLQSDINKDLQKLLGGDLETEPFIQQFTKGNTNNYYAVIKGNAPAAAAGLLERITDTVRQVLTQNQNIYYGELLLKKLQEAIAATLRYWEQNGIDDQLDWNKFVSGRINRITHWTYRLFGQRKNTVQDRVEELVNLMKMSVMRDVLVNISTDVGTDPPVADTAPSLKRLDEFKKGVEKIRTDLVARLTKIEEEVSDESVPVLRVWSKGSFGADLREIVASYRRKENRYPGFSDIKGAKANLWDEFDHEIKAIRKANEDVMAVEDLFEKIKKSFQDLASRYIPTVDPAKYACANPRETAKYSHRALAGLLKLKKAPLCGTQGIPRLVLGSNEAVMESVIDALHENDQREFQKQHVCRLDLLSDAVFFYEEKSRIEPLGGLVTSAVLKQKFDNPPPGGEGGRLSPQIWRQHRLAYGVNHENLERRKRRGFVRKLMLFAVNFGLKYAKPSFSDRWVATATRWQDPLNIVPGTAGTPPSFQFKNDQGLLMMVELTPDSLASLRSVADDEIVFSRFTQAIVATLAKVSDDQLKEIYNSEILPRLTSDRSAVDANAFAGEFFGAKNNDGTMTRGIIEEIRNKVAETGADTHA
jgi:hypothetical protein